MRQLLALLLITVPFAGCAATPEDAAPSTGPAPSIAPDSVGPAFNFTAGIEAPTWNIGDWWQYSIRYNSGENFDAKIVVYGKEGDKYLITSDSRDLVLRSAFNHYPNIGPVNRKTFDQYIHGAQVGYLKFPMKNGTWTAQYRDFQMEYESHYVLLEAGSEVVPGFVTSMAHQGDKKVRMIHGWSPVTKWFTDYVWDFDGNAPFDVIVTLTAWGSNFTGSLPVVALGEIVHRAFPTSSVPPATAPPNGPPSGTVQFKVASASSTLIVGMFAGAGGQGAFEVEIGPQGAAVPTRFEWQPGASGGSHFQWNRLEKPSTGDWQLAASGAAQNAAFLFVEAYETTTTEISL